MGDPSKTLITSNSCVSYWSRIRSNDNWHYLDFNYFTSNDLGNFSEIYVLIEFESLMDDFKSAEKIIEYLKNLEIAIKSNKSTKFILMPWYPSNLDAFTWEAAKVRFSRIRKNVFAKNKLLELNDIYSNTVYFDLEFIIDNLGRLKSESEIGWSIASCRLSNDASKLVLDKINRFQLTNFTEGKKVLLLDFDNTLWGGVIGEDDYESIKIAKNGKGFGYYSFQTEILQLIQKGILICGVTKNNYDDVTDFFSKRDMPLKLSAFSKIYANWDPKHSNIKRLSADFNLPTSSMVFIDDSKFERHQAMLNIPDLTVLEPPKDEFKLVNWISNEVSPAYFPKRLITQEDEIRQESYKRRGNYSEVSSETIRSVITLHINSESSLDRVSQMSEKTNQFNLRKIKFSREDLNAYMSSSEKLIAAFEYEDKFGSEGIVGYVMLSESTEKLIVDSFVMSCRVIGRNLEEKMMEYITEEAKRRSKKVIETEPYKTGKNQICLEFFRNKNFLPVQNSEIWIKNVE